jgi:hypothetical protein
MDPARTVEIRGDEARILLEAENKDMAGEYFRWCRMEW